MSTHGEDEDLPSRVHGAGDGSATGERSGGSSSGDASSAGAEAPTAAASLDAPLTQEDLPEVFEGELDGALFEALMNDLSDHAEILGVLIKGGAEERADEPHVSLDQARMLLVLGKVRAIQIHYRHEGATWIDTLMRGPQSIRLVRMEAPAARVQPAAAPAAPDERRRLPVLD
ncbi:MAG: hypothetical protein KF901_15935 [Myxococcales bacterium]|nr:hypothetical protein [Myxococcales bacterium]